MLMRKFFAKVDTGAAARAAEAPLARPEALDMLVVGGGPAGAAATMYAARKGVGAGVVASVRSAS